MSSALRRFLLPGPFGTEQEGAVVDDEFRARFRRECRIAAGLHHPHIVPGHAFGEIGLRTGYGSPR